MQGPTPNHDGLTNIGFFSVVYSNYQISIEDGVHTELGHSFEDTHVGAIIIYDSG